MKYVTSKAAIESMLEAGVPFEEASDAIVLRAQAASLEYDANRILIYDEDGGGPWYKEASVPSEFWMKGPWPLAAWKTGEFRSLTSIRGRVLVVSGMKFEEDGIASLAAELGRSGSSLSAPSVDRKRSPGRPPKASWPDFAEELAMYFHEFGLPVQTTGEIASVHNAIANRLALRGIEGPDPRQTNDLIRRTIDRMRS
ncbi:hypothetical protein [Sphingomonas qomolangmaensis]|uniref:Uncharacterized protein n=1 Tax=Sphingomonas qomolangmaensis TaxID=2918765 RepID=A0ABY5LBY2_9SPHN|nr:hypothetical protein [Sphingomonas qomolangmaensis]UUL83441.1 hypothetical protein NMP03_04220 [Sphingomonas qomolangmaensis]